MNFDGPDAPSRDAVPPALLTFWGKARPSAGAAISSHPVVYHGLDVAAMVDAILRARPLALARAGTLFGLAPNDARALLVTLAALHDIGKFATVFQAKSLEHWPNVLAAVDPAKAPPSHHTADGYALWQQVLRARIADGLWMGGGRTLDLLAPAVFGHHGRPLKHRDGKRLTSSLFAPAGSEAAIAFADAVVALLMPTPVGVRAPSEERTRIASWWVAGLMTVADWIGSNERWFAYTAADATDVDLSRYWVHARTCAARAVLDAGIAAPMRSAAKTFTALTRIATPSPAQQWASDVALPNGPLLIIIEDVTGAGKTEAAQMLVHRLMTDGRAAGAYWAMPTQATANAMYERQRKAVDALFDHASGDARPSVVLAHGQTKLHDGFRATVLRAPETRLDTSSSELGLPAGAACAAFLADDRRAALLADVGAGTIDQALLGALPSRFNTVRLFGLADKVLVFDEAHAYDAYMGVEAQQLLRFQAALGGSAIVLSATLSRSQRAAFATAWVEGLADGQRRVAPLGVELSPLTRATDYPLTTIVSSAAEPVQEYPIAAAEWSRRQVPVRFVHESAEALAHVVDSARRGAAVAWIRNTVEDCLTSAAEVRALGLWPIVFHARFAQGDRQARERAVLTLFGKEGLAADRRGAVLIATQVVEQSLDLDFDVLVTDLAPVDLLIQRAGRLQRHPARNADRPPDVVCELIVLSPVPDETPGKDWLTAVLPRTRYVYQNVGVLWRTVKALANAHTIDTPNGLRALIDAVYDSDDVPDALFAVAQAAQGKDFGDAAAANMATLELTDSYFGDLKGWVDDVKPMTRVGDEQTTVRLARALPNGKLAPWATDDGPAWRAWALSEVRLRAGRVPFGSMPDARYATAIAAVRAEWGRFEQELTVLPLIERVDEPGTWEGELTRPKDERVVRIRYTASEGVAYVPEPR